MRLPIAVAIAASLVFVHVPRANAQAVVVVPAGASIVLIAGITYYVWANWQGVEQRVPTANAIIDNPDEPSSEEWDYIWADDYNQAVRKCREKASQYGGTYSRVVQKPGSTRYECYWWTN
jgi:hypothetical protein